MLIAKVINEGFLHSRCPCFDIVFAQLGVIPRTRNNFVEVTAAVEYYFIITHVKKKRIKEVAVPNVIICCWKTINKKERNFFVPNLQHFHFELDV